MSEGGLAMVQGEKGRGGRTLGRRGRQGEGGRYKRAKVLLFPVMSA